MEESKISEDFIAILKQAQKNETLVSVYADLEDVSHFDIGKPRWISAEEVVIESYDTYGHFDGFCWLLLEDIFRIDIKGRYERKIELLHKSNSQMVDRLPSLNKNVSLLAQMLQYAVANMLVVEIEQGGSGSVDLQGYIVEVQCSSAAVRLLSNYGEDDGMSQFKFSSVSKLRVNSTDGRALAYLNTCSNESNI